MKRKFLFSTILLLIFSFFSFAQDKLFLKNGQQIKSLIQEINPEFVKFRRFENPDGPLYSLPKSEVLKIEYKNGQTEEISPDGKEHSVQSSIQPKLHYGGPRVGITYLGSGYSNHRIEEAFNRSRINQVTTQFGWQFETRFFTLENGGSGLIELVPMIGGLEQGLFIPSLTGMVGFRTHQGYELGMGPILSFGGVGVLFATGTSLKYGDVVFPINLAFLPSYQTDVTEEIPGNDDPLTPEFEYTQKITERKSTGFRVTLTIGFNSRSK